MNEFIKRAYYRRESDKAPGYWRECYEKLVKTNAALTKERDAYRSIAEGEPLDAYQAVCEQLAAAQATNKKLAGYLWKFGRHFEDCGWQMNKPCNCGFEAANSTANDTTALDARLFAQVRWNDGLAG